MNMSLPPTDYAVLAKTLSLILEFEDPHTHTCAFGIRVLAERRGVNRDVVRGHVAALSEIGRIRILKNNRHDVVCVLRG